MREYRVDPDVRAIWRQFPLRISNGSISPCCNQLRVIVQTSDGGFVQLACPQCLATGTLSNSDFMKLDLVVSCPKCNRVMERRVTITYANYGFVCTSCDLELRFCELLPMLDDLALR